MMFQKEIKLEKVYGTKSRITRVFELHSLERLKELVYLPIRRLTKTLSFPKHSILLYRQQPTLVQASRRSPRKNPTIFLEVGGVGRRRQRGVNAD